MSAEVAARAAATTVGDAPFGTLLVAEWRKVQRTWVLPLTILGPLGVTLLGAIYFAFENERVRATIAGGTPPWQGFMQQLGYAQVFALILGTALLASMIADVDHRSSTWKQVLALPITRTGVYFAKFVLLVALLAVASVLCGLGFAGLWVWQDLGGGLPVKELMLASALPFLGVLPVAAFLLLLSTALTNQAVPLVVGVAVTMFGLAGEPSPSMPFSLPIFGEMIAVGFEEGVPTLAGWSVGWMLVLLVAGLVLVSRRDVV